jgi:hypothetical protein
MGQLFFRGFFLGMVGWASCVWGLAISIEESEIVGQKIFANECSGKVDRLVWWNVGEEFASLGIGHFIWYPEGSRGIYEESFPELVAFLKEKGVEVPKCAEGKCPWKSQEEWKRKGDERIVLQDWLEKTIGLQAVFIGKRWEGALEQMGSEEKVKIDRLCSSSEGKFALIDYVNFKGVGCSEEEKYEGVGWGLKQVLERMDGKEEEALKAFSKAAEEVLKERVKRAPPERKEERWLPGWLNRVNRYLKS